MRLPNPFVLLFGSSVPPTIVESDAATANSQPSVLITAEDSARTIRILPGQSLGIAVGDNASIGFIWHVAKLSPKLRSDGYHYPDPPSLAVGDGSKKLFRFTALRRGRADLRLVRHFRGKAEKVLTFEILIE
jgi:predicted secreted protein